MADEIKNIGDVEKPAESSDKKRKNNTRRVNRLFWVALAILIILLILSIVLLSMRIHNFSSTDADGDEINVNISADKNQEFEIFSAEYRNGKGQVTIQSSDGQPVIAPSAYKAYTLRIKNDDDVAIDYTFKPEVEYTGGERLPLDVKFIAPDGEYLVGGDDEWGTFDDFADLAEQNYTQTLPKDEAHFYTFIWYWNGDVDDARDTALAMSPEELGISVKMALHNEMNTAQDANGAVLGFGVNDMLWFLIFFILLLIAILLFVLSLITRRVEPEPAVVYVPTPVPVPTPEPIPVAAAPAPEPEPEPEPIVIPKPAPYKKGKGFVGKMAYVNIDTLAANFGSDDVINLKLLKEKKLVDAKATQVKILARTGGSFDKALHVQTQGISAQAKQIILAAGGTVEITEG